MKDGWGGKVEPPKKKRALSMEALSEDKVSRKVYRSERGFNGVVITERGSPKAARPWSAHRRNLREGDELKKAAAKKAAATTTLDDYPKPTGQGYQYAFATRLADTCYSEDKSKCSTGDGSQLTRSSAATYNPPGSPLPPPPGPPVVGLDGKSIFSEGELYCTYFDVLSTKCANKCSGSVCLICDPPMSKWADPGHCRIPTEAEKPAPGTPCKTAEVDLCSTNPILFEVCDDAVYVKKGPATLKYDPMAAKSSMKKMEKYKGKRLGSLNEYGDRNPGTFEAIYEYQTAAPTSSAGGGGGGGGEESPTSPAGGTGGGGGEGDREPAPEKLGCADYVAEPRLCTAESQFILCDNFMPCYQGKLFPEYDLVVAPDQSLQFELAVPESSTLSQPLGAKTLAPVKMDRIYREPMDHVVSARPVKTDFEADVGLKYEPKFEAEEGLKYDPKFEAEEGLKYDPKFKAEEGLKYDPKFKAEEALKYDPKFKAEEGLKYDPKFKAEEGLKYDLKFKKDVMVMKGKK